VRILKKRETSSQDQHNIDVVGSIDGNDPDNFAQANPNDDDNFTSQNVQHNMSLPNVEMLG